MTAWGSQLSVNEAYGGVVGAGRIPGITTLYKFGINGDVGANFETCWSGGGTYTFPTAALPVRVASGGDLNDTAAGTGARTVRVYGLDAAGLEIQEDISLAGASQSSQTSQSFFRVNRAYVTEVGAYGGSNVGDISVENTSSQALAHIPAGYSQTQQLVYTVPLGKTASMTEFHANTNVNRADFRFCIRPLALNTASEIQAARIIGNWFGVTEITDRVTAGIGIPELTDFWCDARRVSGGSNSSVAAYVSGTL